MTLISRIFCRKFRDIELEKDPQERDMHMALAEAKRQNKEAAEKLATATSRQVRDTELIRQVIDDVLSRAEKRKVRDINRKAAR